MWQHCGDRAKLSFAEFLTLFHFSVLVLRAADGYYIRYTFFAMKLETNYAGEETVGVAYSLCRKCRQMQTKNVILQQFRDFTLSPIISWRFLVVSVVRSRVSPENVDRSP